MAPESVPRPDVLDRVDVADDAPEPDDCLPPSETPVATVELSPGWLAATDREFLAYHPDQDPPVKRVLRANVTGLSLRRAGGGGLLGYVPGTAVAALGSLLVGLLLLSVDPTGLTGAATGSQVDPLESVFRGLARAATLLGSVLVFAGILAGLGAAAAVAHWLLSREVRLVFECGRAEPLECPTKRPAGRRALETMRSQVGTERDLDDRPLTHPGEVDLE